MIADLERVDGRLDLIFEPADRLIGVIGPGRSLGIKPAIEAVVAAVLLVAVLPILLLVMALVKLTSRGPAIYRQVRVGWQGRPFVIYKVRTMTDDCERQTGPRWSFGKDSRVTPLGRFLRRVHLDELPQLWNVIQGDMALVGPRPERPEFVNQLEKAIPRYRERLDVRPGITGLAQVQLPPDADLGSVRRKVACDLCYIEQIGPWLDARILMATALKMAHVPLLVSRRLFCLPGVGVTEAGPDAAVRQWQAS